MILNVLATVKYTKIWTSQGSGDCHPLRTLKNPVLQLIMSIMLMMSGP